VDYIRPGSPADLSCKIFVGDEVVSMDGKSLHGMQVQFHFIFIFYFYSLVWSARRHKFSKRALFVTLYGKYA
jgi:hypothetical protein